MDAAHQITLTSTEDLRAFLAKRGITLEEMLITWTCPKCGTLNYGAYYSHPVKCHVCIDFEFPKLSTQEADPNGAIRAKIDELTREKREIEDKMSCHYNAIAELEEQDTDIERTIADLCKCINVEVPL